MAGHTLAVLNMAALIGGAESLMDDNRRNRRRAINAQEKADDAFRMAEDWNVSADRLRLIDPKVRDWMAGLAYPSQPDTDAPSAFAATPSVIVRPYMTEAMATAPTSYPPKVNLYDAYGRFLHPTATQDGENFLHGLVQNFGELRAADLGATFEDVPNKTKLEHIFRHHRGLMEALVTLEASGITLEQAREAWLRFYGSGAGGSQVLWRLMEDTPTLTATGVFTSFTLPANYLQVGDTAILYFSPRLPAGAVNVDFTPKVNLTGTLGPLLWSPYGPLNPNTLALANESSVDCQVRITRRANDSLGANQFAISGSLICGSHTVMGGMGGGSASVVSFDHEVDQVIALGGTFSAAMSVKITEGKFIRET